MMETAPYITVETAPYIIGFLGAIPALVSYIFILWPFEHHD